MVQGLSLVSPSLGCSLEGQNLENVLMIERREDDFQKARGPLWVRFPEEGRELCTHHTIQASQKMYPSREPQVSSGLKELRKRRSKPFSDCCSHSNQQGLLLRQPQGGLQVVAAEVNTLEKFLPDIIWT